MLVKHITGNYKKTQKLGEIFAEQIIKNELQKTAIIIGLRGDLGSGKTTFIQGFAKGLGVNEKILSPTFVIMKKFQIPKTICHRNGRSSNLATKYFFHFDCYRLKNEKDILELGFKEIISNPENIVAIEWPEKIKKILPRKTIIIKFKPIDKNKREIILDETI